MRPIKLLAPSALFLLLVACTTVPEETDKARGVLSGVNLVLALSVLVVVVAVGLIVGAIAVDRMVRSRGRLAEGQPVIEEEEPEDEVVAGIRVGRAAPPRWLYAAYTLIPIFAFAYIFSNVRPPATEAGPTPTPEGPCEECEIAAEAIAFTKDALTVVAGADITVAFDNTDTVVHDFTVWDNPESGTGEQVATTGNVTAGSEGSVEFTAPEAGDPWSYNCTIHPAMVGTIEPAAG